MLERFNFYDLYAYLLPGLCLLGGAYWPFLEDGFAKSSLQLTPALALLGVGYVLGILLHEIARDLGFFKSTPVPSHALLTGEAEEPLSSVTLNHIRGRIRDSFGLSLSDATPKTDCKSQVDEAFSLCRASVIGSDRARYAEQMQALYGLSRSLSAAALFCAGWYAGLGLRCLHFVSATVGRPQVSLLARFLVGFCLVILCVDSWRRNTTLGSIAWIGGALLTSSTLARTSPADLTAMVASVGLALAASILFRQSYLRFAHHFAKGTLIGFLAQAEVSTRPPSAPAKD